VNVQLRHGIALLGLFCRSPDTQNLVKIVCSAEDQAAASIRFRVHIRHGWNGNALHNTQQTTPKGWLSFASTHLNTDDESFVLIRMKDAGQLVPQPVSVALLLIEKRMDVQMSSHDSPSSTCIQSTTTSVLPKAVLEEDGIQLCQMLRPLDQFHG
jgi:hypothetical protein